MNVKTFSFNDLKKAMTKGSKEYDIPTIKKAYKYAEKAHEGQFRKSGEAYINHPIAVAYILVELGMDSDTIIAALLHDTVEDTASTIDELNKIFGGEVAALVEAVTKLAQIPFVSKEEQQAENIRKMLLAMAKDIRVIIIKLADRLHNMRTLFARGKQKQRDIAKETLEIYAPIAHRLGIRAIKEELEDIAIQYLDPIAYKDIEESLSTRREYREAFLREIIERIMSRVTSVDPHVHLDGRIKSIHGIYRKMFIQGKNFDEIYDIYAVRIITDTVANCYNVFGYIHDMFKPIPGRFKDYISTPKPNMYQSLHTTVISREGIPFEVQIRTWEMHKTAEYGIAAHWKYKDGVKDVNISLKERLSWVRQLLESQSEADDAEEIVQSIKTDLSQENIFAVTPKGDIISLPSGSTIIDFAYAIHSAVGNRTVGAKINGRITTLDHIIETGEVIEILTSASEQQGPRLDWLKIVKTSEARNKIRAWHKKERRPENIAEGKQQIDREFRRNHFMLTEQQYDEIISKIYERRHYKTVDDFYAAIGYGGIQLANIMPKFKELYNKMTGEEEPLDIDSYITSKNIKHNENAIIVNGMNDCLIKISRCCEPLPGDAIIGFITRGHGVSVHKRDCKNVPVNISETEEPDRWVSVKWSSEAKEDFQSTLAIHALDHPSLLPEIAIALAGMKLPIHTINAREVKGGNREIIISISIENLTHLSNIIAKLSKVDGVFAVERTGI